jgi:hypothetical protein
MWVQQQEQGAQGSCLHLCVTMTPADAPQAGSPAPDGRTDVSPRITTIYGQQLPAVLPTIASTAAASTAVLSELVQRPPEATTAAFAAATTLTRASRGLSPPPPGAATQVGNHTADAHSRRHDAHVDDAQRAVCQEREVQCGQSRQPEQQQRRHQLCPAAALLHATTTAAASHFLLCTPFPSTPTPIPHTRRTC